MSNNTQRMISSDFPHTMPDPIQNQPAANDAEPALSPCPFCGSTNIQPAPRRGYPIQVSCRTCGAEGPEKFIAKLANEAWNKQRAVDLQDALNLREVRMKRLETELFMFQKALDQATSSTSLELQLKEANEKIKRLEESGDEMASLFQHGVSQQPAMVSRWLKAKEEMP